ncbi:MAG: TerB N-terminal domain-containing protein, partial [Clostridia bacterium]|nr:TerB N-terminal domain-containing protein [Clostridia bacterium]
EPVSETGSAVPEERYTVPPREEFLSPAEKAAEGKRKAEAARAKVGAYGSRVSPGAASSARRSAYRSAAGRDVLVPGTESYSPDLPLISSVTVIPWTAEYTYYLSFCETAARLADYTSDKCRYKPFFSYMPQYSQMDAEQLGYYFYLRESVKNGVYPEADASYLLLLIYESINLSMLIDPEQLLAVLCGIAEGYGRDFPRVAMRLSDWICDFCLIHRLTLPKSVSDATRAMLSSYCSLKEFYLSGDITDAAAGILISASGYDYRKSKYYTGDNRTAYDTHIPAAFRAVLARLGEEEMIGMLTEREVSRDSFVGAICGPSSKKRLRVTYRSLSRSYEFRFAVSDILKNAENRLRSALGIRGTVKAGNPGKYVTDALDAYFGSAFPGKGAKPLPEYERLYEPSYRPASTDEAARIEAASWETTDRLISAFAEEEPSDELRYPAVSEPDNAGEEENRGEEISDGGSPVAEEGEFSWIGPWEREFLRACLASDREAERAAASAAGLDLDLFADQINASALEYFGDVILESDGKVYTVSEFYADEIRGVVENE